MDTVTSEMFDFHLGNFLNTVPAFTYKRESDYFFVPKQSPNGFNVGLDLQGNTLVLKWGKWFSFLDFCPISEVFSLLHSILTPKARIREYYKWPFSYRGFLELYENNNWKPEIIESLVFWNPIGIRSVFYYQNNIILL